MGWPGPRPLPLVRVNPTSRPPHFVQRIFVPSEGTVVSAPSLVISAPTSSGAACRQVRRWQWTVRPSPYWATLSSVAGCPL
jgi:hypothetical protein